MRAISCVALICICAVANAERPPAPRLVELRSADGTRLRATYFAAARPGPGLLLFHQSNRTRKSWERVADDLAAAGIHTLTVDSRGHGESGGRDRFSGADGASAKERAGDDLDAAFAYLVARPGVQKDVIGAGGAGVLGVASSVEMARRHTAAVRSLLLVSGETFGPGLDFLRQASGLPELFVVSDGDEYPPTVEAMALLYATASSPSRRLVHYSAARKAPWIWYEPFDVGKVRAGGEHGTDLFRGHPELPGILVGWFVTTLVTTPGHAPADPLAAAPILQRLQSPGGAAEVGKQLRDARARDPDAQIFPEVSASIIGQDFQRVGDPKSSVAVLELVALAYPQSADAHETLAEAYLDDKQPERARAEAAKSLELLGKRDLPASTWSDTPERRGEIRHGAEDVLRKLGPAGRLP